MHRLLLVGCIFALSTSAALSEDDPMANLFGNTLVVVSASGMESHTVYSADHSFSGVVPSMSYKYQGTWAIDDKGQLCRTFDPSVPGRTNPDCAPITSHAVGDKWTDPDGSNITLSQGVN